MSQRNLFHIPRMALSEWNIAVLHNKNPWMPMWWSAALPGLGHLCQGEYFKGLTLMTWEIIINFKAKLNQAILYTAVGDFEKASELINPGWALLYGAVFCFSIYDSYRNNVEINILARIERKQKKRSYRFMKMSAVGINYIIRTNPWVAAGWSALLPGFGHIYNRKAFKGFIILGWAVAIVYFSRINDAIIATFTGQFTKVDEIIDYQWLLFFPSIYLFSMWDSYNDSVEVNKLFSEVQKEYLKKEYGNKH